MCCVNPGVYVSVQDYKNQFDSRDSRVNVCVLQHLASKRQCEKRTRKVLSVAMGGLVQMCVATVVPNRSIQIAEHSHLLLFVAKPTRSYNQSRPWPPKNRNSELQKISKIFNRFFVKF